MKFFTMLVLSLLIIGCVEADSIPKFKTEVIGKGYWNIQRTVDLDYNVVCYTYDKTLSCVKL